jgi:hypothetical protein
MGYNGWLFNDYVVKITFESPDGTTEVTLTKRVSAKDSYTAIAMAALAVDSHYAKYEILNVEFDKEDH